LNNLIVPCNNGLVFTHKKFILIETLVIYPLSYMYSLFKEWVLSSEDIEFIALGASLLGAGGGGM
jgi:hypothetical protein